MPSAPTTLAIAVDAYKTKMSASNRAFFTAKVRRLESDRSLTDTDRLDLLAPYFQMPRWPTTGYGSSIVSPSQSLLARGEQGHVDLGIDSDGTIPAKTVEQQAEFLEDLQRLMEQSFPGIELPDEYVQLLSLVDAISDPDFRGSGTAGMDGVCSGPLSGWHLADKLPEQLQWERQGWTVVGGWQCGIGDMSATQLLYSKKDVGVAQDEEQLRYRVYAFDRENFEGSWFASVKDWLEWKGNWLERLPAGWEDSRPDLPEEEESEEDEL